MSSVFPHGIKDLKISGPTSVGQVSSSLRCKVIVVAKFDFDAETSHELSVRKGDVLKLLDRLQNGWVLVEFIDKIASPGLVPSLYVDIAVNDPINPVTLSWLHEVSVGGSQMYKTFNDIQVQMLLEKNAPASINNKLYPLSVSVSNYLMFENRFWYRVDVTYSSGESGYLCRYYSDFYDLHVSLLAYVNTAEKQDGVKLPKLPEPVPSQKRNSAEQRQLFSGRCRDLSMYMNELISTKRFQVCAALVDWLDVAYKKMPGFVADDPPQETCDVINQRILPGSVILASKNSAPVVDSPAEDTSFESIKYVTPSKDGPKVIKPKNVYNHYQQAANAKINIARSLSTSDGRYPVRKSSKLERSKTVSTAHGQAGVDPVATSPTLYKSQSVKTPKTGSKTAPKMGPSPHSTGSPVPAVPAMPQKMASPLSTPRQRITESQQNTPPQKTSPNMLSNPNSQYGPKRSPTNKENEAIGLKTPRSHHGTPQQNATPTFSPRNVSFGTPTTRKSSQSTGRLVRCEIKTHTNDSIVVRVDAAETRSVDAFKAAIYAKYAFNNLFIRVEEGGSYEEIDTVPHVTRVLQQAATVFMLVT